MVFKTRFAKDYSFKMIALLSLKAYSKVWDNYWRFKNDEKCFLFLLKSYFRSQDIWSFVSDFGSWNKTAWLER